MGLHRDNHAVRRSQGVYRNHAQGRHTINENHIIVLLDLIDIDSQRKLPAHGGDQAHFQRGQLNVGGHKVYTLDVVHYALICGEWLIPDHFFHDRGQGGGQAVLVLPAQAGGEVALGVCVNEQHLFPQTG